MQNTEKEKFEEICELIRSVDSNGDAIRQTLKLRTISEKIRVILQDEKIVRDIFDVFNARALEDENFIPSLVIVITSRQLESLCGNGKLLRDAMVSILQRNFQNADKFKRDQMKKFYNSVKLLGEYFNKARLSTGLTIDIIGKSLLNLINDELEKELGNICHFKNDHFARLVLSQITLNGSIFQKRHRTDIEQVLFTIRKCLIELHSLTAKTKAFLIMTLDLYYSNFTNVGHKLERMYQRFLLDDVKNVNSTESENEGFTRFTEKSNEDYNNRKGKKSLTKSGPTTPERSIPTKPIRNSQKSPLKTSPPQRNVSQSPKKLSPQELRSRKSPPAKNGRESTSPRQEKVVETVKVQNNSKNSVVEQNSPTNSEAPSQNDENILRQQNSRSSTPSSTAKSKVINKVYFREENVENLTWNDETTDDPETSTSPKVNPYTSSFLNFLSRN